MTTLGCPGWCTVDHVGNLARDLRTKDRVQAILDDEGRGDLVPEDHDRTIHECVVAEVEVFVDSTPCLGLTRVVVSQLAGDDLEVEVLPAHGWSEQYTPGQARALAAGLLQAADLIDREGRSSS